MKPIRLLACLTLAFHVSCAIGPNYKKPIVEVPEVYRGSLDSREAKSLADLAWWEVFDDPVLVELIETALNNNLDLQMAVARTEQAYRLSKATNSAFYPQVGYQGSASRAKSQNFNSSRGGVEYTSYVGAFNVAWEIDVWGRIRRASEAAKAQLLASEEFQRGVLLSVVSEVATLYFALLELDRAHAIGIQAIEAFEETLTLFTRKYEGGVASRLEVTRAAAAEAQAHDFIRDMKDAYQTRVGERGGRLSGGQRQRVAIARIFLRRPKIILLDEATSALDEDSQQAVQASLDALIRKGDSTVVLVAHRLSTVMNADKIAVIADGGVKEEGSHDELCAKGGVYAGLVRKQLTKAAAVLDQGKEDVAEAKAANDTIDKLMG